MPGDHAFHSIFTDNPHPIPFDNDRDFQLDPNVEYTSLERNIHSTIFNHVDFPAGHNLGWQMSQTNLPGHVQHLASVEAQAEDLQYILDIRPDFDHSTNERMMETVLDPLAEHFPDAEEHARKHPKDSSVIYAVWDHNFPDYIHVGRSVRERLSEYFRGDEAATSQLCPPGHRGSGNIRGVILLDFSGDELYTNSDYPVASYVAVENVEAILTMLLTPPTGLADCPGMKKYGGRRQLPDDNNFVDRLNECLSNIESGVYVDMPWEEFRSDSAFMHSLSEGKEYAHGQRPLSAVRQKLVDEAGLATLYNNLMAERATHQATHGINRYVQDDDGWFSKFDDLVEWLQGHEYRYPSASSGSSAFERKLGKWVNNIRNADRGAHDMTLDDNRRAHLDAINFVWVGARGRFTYSAFSDNWANQIENDEDSNGDE